MFWVTTQAADAITQEMKNAVQGSRWVGAAEALARGLVNQIDDDPDRAAAGLAGTLAALGPQAPGRIKRITSAGGLLDRLRAERLANRAAWDQMNAPGDG